ncbi:MAG TPA: hypothetical protein VIT65_28625 [Microlunatus sp.]
MAGDDRFGLNGVKRLGPLDAPTGDVDKDLLRTVLLIQAQQDGAGVDLAAPPWLGRWSDDAESRGAYLIRGQVDKRNRVADWLKHGNVTITVSMFRRLPDPVTPHALMQMVEELYEDYPVTKRDAKKHDVVNFLLGMRPGDLICTDDNGRLRIGQLKEADATLDSIGGLNLLVRPVQWFAEAEPEITTLPRTLRTRLRFKGEDVVKITDLVEELERRRSTACCPGLGPVA